MCSILHLQVVDAQRAFAAVAVREAALAEPRRLLVGVGLGLAQRRVLAVLLDQLSEGSILVDGGYRLFTKPFLLWLLPRIRLRGRGHARTFGALRALAPRR